MKRRVRNIIKTVKVGFKLHDVQNYRYLITLFLFLFWTTVIGLIMYGLVGIYQATTLGVLVTFRGVLFILVDALMDGRVELKKKETV